MISNGHLIHEHYFVPQRVKGAHHPINRCISCGYLPPQKACVWVTANGADANNRANAASTVLLKVMVVLEFINLLEQSAIIGIMNQ